MNSPTAAPRVKWRRVLCTLLVGVMLAASAYFVWRYRHDRSLRNEVMLRLYALTTHAHDRTLLLVGDSNVASMSCAQEFAGWRVLNLGVPGLFTETMLGYVGAQTRTLPRFDAAILWVGINDLVYHQLGPVDAARNVLKVLKELEMVSVRVAVVRQAPLPKGTNSANSARVNRELTTMNAMIAESARPKLAAVITPFKVEAGILWDDFYIDDLHLNERGYRLVCSEAGRWLSEHE